MPCNEIDDRSFQNYLLLFIQDDRCHKERGLFFKTTKHLGGKLELHDRLRSTYTPKIGVHWRRYLKSRSDLRVLSNRRPFQIIRSMADLLLSTRRPFQCEDRYVLLPCHIMYVGQVLHPLHKSGASIVKVLPWLVGTI
jgi:uncharacterized protein YjiS (DUF1127 family)